MISCDYEKEMSFQLLLFNENLGISSINVLLLIIFLIDLNVKFGIT